MDGGTFLVYIRRVLEPTLIKGQIVIIGNLPAHKIVGVRQAIEAADAYLRYLPAYSPDFNPIEKIFIRKKAARIKEALWDAISEWIDILMPNEYRNYFNTAGLELTLKNTRFQDTIGCPPNRNIKPVCCTSKSRKPYDFRLSHISLYKL